MWNADPASMAAAAFAKHIRTWYDGPSGPSNSSVAVTLRVMSHYRCGSFQKGSATGRGWSIAAEFGSAGIPRTGSSRGARWLQRAESPTNPWSSLPLVHRCASGFFVDQTITFSVWPHVPVHHLTAGLLAACYLPGRHDPYSRRPAHDAFRRRF
jgi:hypothetical protein